MRKGYRDRYVHANIQHRGPSTERELWSQALALQMSQALDPYNPSMPYILVIQEAA